MTVADGLAYLNISQRARLDWDFEQGNPSFILVEKFPRCVIGVYLDKIDRLEILEIQGRWFSAKIKPKETT